MIRFLHTQTLQTASNRDSIFAENREGIGVVAQSLEQRMHKPLGHRSESSRRHYRTLLIAFFAVLCRLVSAVPP